METENTPTIKFNDISRGCSTISADPNSPKCCSSGSYKLDVHNWLEDVPQSPGDNQFVEIRFKNTRKGYYLNINSLHLQKGDIVAVEALPGHDIGIVSLTGPLVLSQMRKYNISKNEELKKIYRKAKPADIEKWEKAVLQEQQIMLKAREIAFNLRLNMKIGDVDFQGDATKAIFYYIAEDRVDFRELIKVLAEQFKIRIEMRQIGARQEAGRIGGLGTCGRELCCSTWLTNFVTVTTTAARYQEMSLNPQKLAGQCGKLKCCLNYELETYVDAQRDFPPTTVNLHAQEGVAYHQKTDVFKGIMWYIFNSRTGSAFISLPVARVKQIIDLNKKGQKPDAFIENIDAPVIAKADYTDVVSEERADRFDGQQRKKRKRPKFKKQ